jgi:hypothetical protein
MAIPGKGTRRIVVDGMAYRWRVAYDRLAWDKGYQSDVRIVFQAAEPPGQLLLADFMGIRRQTGDALSNPFTPGFARILILAGLARGSRPRERIRQPVRMDEANVRPAVEPAT